MTQANGLSPRVSKQQQQQQQLTTAPGSTVNSNSTTNNNRTPSSPMRSGRFFGEQADAAVASAAGLEGRSTWKGHNNGPRMPLFRAAGSANLPMKRSTVRFLAVMVTMMSAVPWLCSRGGGSLGAPPSSAEASLHATSSLRAAAVPAAPAASEVVEHAAVGRATAALPDSKGEQDEEDRCLAFRRISESDPAMDRGQQCASVLPTSMAEGQEGWLVSVHVDRAPSSLTATRLRGAQDTKRQLPHQYYVRALEATLHSIAIIEPGAEVNVALFSEGRWGGLIDEMGVPLDWDVPSELCAGLGLRCNQSLVLLNDPTPVPNALECIAVSDVFVASESDFSRAAAVLSERIKVLTDKWEVDEDEMMIALNPATTIAGMSTAERTQIKNLVADYRDCSSSHSFAAAS